MTDCAMLSPGPCERVARRAPLTLAIGEPPVILQNGISTRFVECTPPPVVALRSGLQRGYVDFIYRRVPPVSVATFRSGALGLLAAVAVSRAAGAQYYNTHSGHPGRVEDASPIGRRSVDVDLFGIRVERLQGGITRTRLDPGITWGALPHTEVGVRLPVVWIDVPGSRTRTAGVAGVAVRVMRAFNLETPGVPAFGLSTEALLPAGGLAAPGTSYLVKAMASKRGARGRWHVNVGAGSYSVRTASAVGSDSLCADGSTRCNGPPIIVDVPCYVGPSSDPAPSV